MKPRETYGITSAQLSLGMKPNNRFERSRGSIFGELRGGSMIGINQLHLSSTQPRVAQPHRYTTNHAIA
jgi:hypothetical protein